MAALETGTEEAELRLEDRKADHKGHIDTVSVDFIMQDWRAREGFLNQ